jgi:hypothetical protein
MLLFIIKILDYTIPYCNSNDYTIPYCNSNDYTIPYCNSNDYTIPYCNSNDYTFTINYIGVTENSSSSSMIPC